MNFEQIGDDLTAEENKHWREVAEYERYTKPLLVRLRAVEWPALLALHSARWHREAVETIRARTPKFHYCSSALSHQELIKESQKHKPSGYGWLGSYYNAHTGRYRQIQRYPLLYIWDTGTYPVRFCPPEGPPVSWGFWFRTSDFKNPDWTPESQAWQNYEARKKLVGKWLIDREATQRSGPNRRQFLADSLRSISQQLGRYVRKDYWNANGMFYESLYELGFDLNKVLSINNKPETYYSLDPATLGEVEAKWEHFQRCLREFYEAEKAAPAAIPEMPAQPTPPAKGSPAADVRRYFPAVAAILGPNPTDESALADLARWLLHWTERHGHPPAGNEYLLAGQLREQQAAHSHRGKFLKVCQRLHEALLPLAANEQDVKKLLGNEYGPHSRTNLLAVLKWWAGWIREQQAADVNPAGAYLAALKRVPVLEEWENGSPRYTLPAHLLDMEGFTAEIAPQRQAFEAALPDLPTKKQRALRHELNELLSIDRASVKRRREQFERGDYGLDFLPADYPALRFDVAGRPGSFKWQWVGPLFWGGLSTLLQYRQGEARAAFEKLNAALGEFLPVPEQPKNGKPLDTPAPSSPRPELPETPTAPPAASPWVPLLVGELKITELFSVFADCGLLTRAGGELTSLGRGEGLRKARKAPWAGTLQALMQAGLLDTCAAAVCRALADPAGEVQVSLNEGTLRDYSTKAGTYLEAANGYLKERGLLRK